MKKILKNYKKLFFKYHSDTGTEPDDKVFAQLIEEFDEFRESGCTGRLYQNAFSVSEKADIGDFDAEVWDFQPGRVYTKAETPAQAEARIRSCLGPDAELFRFKIVGNLLLMLTYRGRAISKLKFDLVKWRKSKALPEGACFFIWSRPHIKQPGRLDGFLKREAPEFLEPFNPDYDKLISKILLLQ